MCVCVPTIADEEVSVERLFDAALLPLVISMMPTPLSAGFEAIQLIFQGFKISLRRCLEHWNEKWESRIAFHSYF